MGRKEYKQKDKSCASLPTQKAVYMSQCQVPKKKTVCVVKEVVVLKAKLLFPMPDDSGYKTDRFWFSAISKVRHRKEEQAAGDLAP